MYVIASTQPEQIFYRNIDQRGEGGWLLSPEGERESRSPPTAAITAGWTETDPTRSVGRTRSAAARRCCPNKLNQSAHSPGLATHSPSMRRAAKAIYLPWRFILKCVSPSVWRSPHSGSYNAPGMPCVSSSRGICRSRMLVRRRAHSSVSQSVGQLLKSEKKLDKWRRSCSSGDGGDEMWMGYQQRNVNKAHNLMRIGRDGWKQRKRTTTITWPKRRRR